MKLSSQGQEQMIVFVKPQNITDANAQTYKLSVQYYHPSFICCLKCHDTTDPSSVPFILKYVDMT